jgi:hypothetical protein
MRQRLKGMFVRLTASRLSALDDHSASRFRGRIGQVVAHTPKASHACVEFPPDGERRPERLDRVPLEFLEVVVLEADDALESPPAPCPAQAFSSSAHIQQSSRSTRT